MSIKNLVLAAAAIASAVSFASTASADNYFSGSNNLDRSEDLEIGFVRADTNGVVNIYSYSNGVQGQLLGSEAVLAGGNADVIVDLTHNLSDDVLAVLEVNGQAVATKDFNIVR